MDFPVEATVHLKGFRNELQALDVLNSHGFQVTDHGPGWVRVKGSFPELKAAKAELEQLVQDHGAQNGPPGTVSSYYGSATRNRSQSGERRDSSHHSQQRSPPRPVPETFIIDSDVFKYANRFRKKEMDDILTDHAAFMTEVASGDSSTVTIRGRNPKAAAQNLQGLLNHLGKSLRTQEVPRRDMDRNGDALLERIRKDGNGLNSVLVCETRDGLHLIGPPKESFDLKQQLMGGSARRRGRSFERGAGSRFRSSSTPETHKDRGRRAGDESPPPRGATGYSPPWNQDPRDAWAPRDSPDARNARDHGAEPDRRRTHWLFSSFRKRSRSEVRRKPEKPNGVPPTREESRQPNSSSFITQLFRNIFKGQKNKKSYGGGDASSSGSDLQLLDTIPAFSKGLEEEFIRHSVCRGFALLTSTSNCPDRRYATSNCPYRCYATSNCPIDSTPPPTAPIDATPPPTAPINSTPPPTAPIDATSPPIAPIDATPPPTAPIDATPPPTAPIDAMPPPTAPIGATPPSTLRHLQLPLLLLRHLQLPLSTLRHLQLPRSTLPSTSNSPSQRYVTSNSREGSSI